MGGGSVKVAVDFQEEPARPQKGAENSNETPVCAVSPLR